MEDKKLIYLKPGELFVSRQHVMVKTLLGSCVSVTMFNRRFRVGGICHATLPEKFPKLRGHKYVFEGVCLSKVLTDESFKFMDVCIYYILNAFQQFGIPKRDIEVKLFGGADVLPNNQNLVTVGRKNIATAQEILQKESLPVTASDTGGNRGRKIIFSTFTGEVFLKPIKKTEMGLDNNLAS